MASAIENIQNYLRANPGMTDKQIAAAMDQYGVSPELMGAATGLTPSQVQQRYDAAKATTSVAAPAAQPQQQAFSNPTSYATPGPSVLPQSQIDTQAGLSDYARPYVETMLGATQRQLFNYDPSGNVTGMKGYTPYSYNPADYYAAFSPLQQQAFQSVGQMQTPGQYGMGTQAANAGILSALSSGARYGQMVTDPYMAAAFMSPYMQNVVDTQMQQAKRQAAIAGQAQQAQAARAGSFGGARDYIQRAQSNAELQRNLQNIQATGTQAAYQDAMKNIQNVAGLGLQGAQAGITGAGTLGQLGTGQLGAQTGIANLQSQMGQQQQQQQQNIINQAVQNYNTAQQYPYMQLGFMQNMLGGLPISTSSQQTYQAAPSTVSQLAGLGIAGLGLSNLLGSKGTGGTSTGGGGINLLNSIGGGLSDAASSAWSGIKDLGSLATGFGGGFFAKGGKVSSKPQGLAALALSKM